jgi:hypothetical protein
MLTLKCLLYAPQDAGFLPQPAEFERVSIPQNEEREILRLVLGQEGSNNKRIEYDLEHRISARPMKKAKQILANMALENLLGKDYMDLNDYYVGGKNDEDDSNVDDDDFDWVDPIDDKIYSWEVRTHICSLPGYSIKFRSRWQPSIFYFMLCKLNFSACIQD